MRALFIAAAVTAALSFSVSAHAQEAKLRVAALSPENPTDPDNLVIARIDLSDQTMHVYVENRLAFVWRVSTGLGGFHTPTGQWNAYWLSPNHRSSIYNNVPMPWSVFFLRGYAVHGTTALDQLGQPASHGCVRLHPDNAEVFFKLVEEYGLNKSLVDGI